MLYIRFFRTSSVGITETWYPWTISPHVLRLTTSSNHRSRLFVSEFDCFRFHIEVRSCSIRSSVSDLFHSTQCPPGVSICHIGRFPSFWGWIILRCLINRVLLILSSVGGHVGCFHILAVVTTMAVGIQMSLQDTGFISLDIYLEVRSLDYMVVLFFIFWGISILFFIISEPVYIPISSLLPFLHPC